MHEWYIKDVVNMGNTQSDSSSKEVHHSEKGKEESLHTYQNSKLRQTRYYDKRQVKSVPIANLSTLTGPGCISTSALAVHRYVKIQRASCLISGRGFLDLPQRGISSHY